MQCIAVHQWYLLWWACACSAFSCINWFFHFILCFHFALKPFPLSLCVFLSRLMRFFILIFLFLVSIRFIWSVVVFCWCSFSFSLCRSFSCFKLIFNYRSIFCCIGSLYYIRFSVMLTSSFLLDDPRHAPISMKCVVFCVCRFFCAFYRMPMPFNRTTWISEFYYDGIKEHRNRDTKTKRKSCIHTSCKAFYIKSCMRGKAVRECWKKWNSHVSIDADEKEPFSWLLKHV